MFSRSVAALITFFVSSTALAWSVPIELCTFPNTPTTGDIPCTFTNADGQSFNGVVTRSENTVYCTGLVAPTPHDPTKAADLAALYSSLDEDPDAAPTCRVKTVKHASLVECPWGGKDPGPEAAIKLCGDGWCLELTAYTDCADYAATEVPLDGVTCYDVT